VALGSNFGISASRMRKYVGAQKIRIRDKSGGVLPQKKFIKTY
jgi:hypothetical protein